MTTLENPDDQSSSTAPADRTDRLSSRFATAGLVAGAVAGACYVVASVILFTSLAGADDGGPSDCPSIGDTCADGTLYAGISPDTRNAMFVLPADAADQMTWDQARGYAEDLDAHGHDDWRLPTIPELRAIFGNRTGISGLNDSSVGGGASYWSSDDYETFAVQHHNFVWPGHTDQNADIFAAKDTLAAVRAVRSGP